MISGETELRREWAMGRVAKMFYKQTVPFSCVALSSF